MKQLRFKDGRFASKPELAGVKLLLSTTALSVFAYYLGLPPQVPASPLGTVKAQNEAIEPLQSLNQTKVSKVDQVTDNLYQEYKTDRAIIYKIVKAWGGSVGKEAVKVSFCESSHNPYASHTDSTARGLFQILQGTWNGYNCTGSPTNPDDNIACAYKIYQANGWNSSASWAASAHCHKLEGVK